MNSKLQSVFQTIKSNYQEIDNVYVYIGNKNENELFRVYISNEYAEKCMNTKLQYKRNVRNYFERVSLDKRLVREDKKTNYYQDASLVLESFQCDTPSPHEDVNGIYIIGNKEKKICAVDFPSQLDYDLELYIMDIEFIISDKVKFIVRKEKDHSKSTLLWKVVVDEYIDTTLETLQECINELFC